MVVSHRPNTSDYLLKDAPLDGTALVDAGERYTYRQLRSAAGKSPQLSGMVESGWPGSMFGFAKMNA